MNEILSPILFLFCLRRGRQGKMGVVPRGESLEFLFLGFSFFGLVFPMLFFFSHLIFFLLYLHRTISLNIISLDHLSYPILNVLYSFAWFCIRGILICYLFQNQLINAFVSKIYEVLKKYNYEKYISQE